jgi:hypothetical protein
MSNVSNVQDKIRATYGVAGGHFTMKRSEKKNEQTKALQKSALETGDSAIVALEKSRERVLDEIIDRNRHTIIIRDSVRRAGATGAPCGGFLNQGR